MRWPMRKREGMLSLLVLLLALACAPPAEEPVERDLATAQFVAQVSSGVLAANAAIQVRFVEEVAGPGQVGKAVDGAVFAFAPPIAGRTYWQDRRTLVLQPTQPLALRSHYRGSLDIAALLPQRPPGAPAKVEMEFDVAGRQVERGEVWFELVQEDDPRLLVLKGQVRFTAPTELAAVQQAARLQLVGTPLQLVWEAAGDLRFNFTSTPIERDDREKAIELHLRAGPLELDLDYLHKLVLSPLAQMEVIGIAVEETGRRPRLQVSFSDPLDERQDIAGLIGVEGVDALRLTGRGDKVAVEGAFAHGQKYTITVYGGVRSRWGSRTGEAYTRVVEIGDLKPQIRFARDGVLLPTANQQKLRFSTLNLARVQLQIKKVFESNLGQFLQTERLDSGRQRRRGFNNRYIERVGVVAAEQSLEIGAQRNQWLQHELDLQALLQEGEKGLFLVALSFVREDMLYGTEEALQQALQQTRQQRRRWRGDDYRNNPYSPGYIRGHGQVFKALVRTDIGLTYKGADQRHMVWATHLDDARPLKGVEVTLRTLQNQVAGRATTNAEGRVDFTGVDQDIFYIEAEQGGQRSLVKPGEMAWNLSTFDTEGVEGKEGGTRAFLYTERGVYRPGDTVHLAAIVRNQDGTFPDGHPVELRLENPRGQAVFEQIQRRGRDGFFHFAIPTAVEDPTGNWRARLTAGGRLFEEVIKVETVAPQRLKVEIEPQQERLAAGDQRLEIALRGAYLFGGVAGGLEARVAARLHSAPKSFAAYKGFTFADETLEYQPLEIPLYEGVLDGRGEARFEWILPDLSGAPGGLEAVLTAQVLEKGGRPNGRRHHLAVDPYARYVGLQRPDFDYGHARVGSRVDIAAILVDPQGRPIDGRPMQYRIYQGTSHWWWEYDDERDFHRRFKSDSSTELVEEGTLRSGERPVGLSFVPLESGKYLVEMQDGLDHQAAFFLGAYAWGAAPTSSGGGDLVLRPDRAQYAPGESAQVRFMAPATGAVLVAVEQGRQILSAAWHPLGGAAGPDTLSIPITQAMVPGAYVSVALLQPHAQRTNDRPMRLYGVLPLEVVDATSQRSLQLEIPGQLKPDAPFSVGIQTADNGPTQFTVAVVDEGLLALTDFTTPDPWQTFFAKVRLGVLSADVFGHIIGGDSGDVFRVFSIGGDMDYRRRQAEPPGKKRFAAVSMFKGPLMTDESGRAVVSFDMPNYMGAVRVMVVAAQGERYGRAEKTVPVRQDLLVQGSLPRVLGPGDRIDLPVTLFALRDGIGPVEVELEVEGPVEIVGPARHRVQVESQGETDLSFALQARPAVGPVHLTLRAVGGGVVARQTVDVQVRASAPLINEVVERTLEPGQSAVLRVPDKGLEGTNRARISVQRRPHINFGHRLRWLVRYPYGCLEQTVSAVFPQLYVGSMLPGGESQEEIDRHLDAGIGRLRRFHLPDGSLAYWPGGSHPSLWGTNYAGHFLLEARDLGYHVPTDLLEGWLRHQRSQSQRGDEALMVRVYRAYLLARAGDQPIGALNLLRENHLEAMSDVQKWLLAGAYRWAGVPQTAAQILQEAGQAVASYSETGGTYGSDWRDRAIILEMMVLFERWAEADALAAQVARILAAQDWHSTQATAFMLLAMGKYLQALEGKGGPPPLMAGQILLPGGGQVPFNSRELAFQTSIDSGFGGQVEVLLEPSSSLERVFVRLDWAGVPLRGDSTAVSRNLRLRVHWYDEAGLALDPSRLRQGTSFWGHFRLSSSASTRRLDELALVQILPAGWEIDNMRLAGAALPQWMADWRLNGEEYLDIRDDRIMWFFDLTAPSQALDFVVRLNAVTPGTYTLPPTLAEAMYDRAYQALQPGGTVAVEGR